MQYPDPVLSTKTSEITEFNAELRALVADMFTAMYENRGIGLANQIGQSVRVAVMHVSGWPEMVLVNPQIVKSKGEGTAQEGCLSVERSGK